MADLEVPDPITEDALARGERILPVYKIVGPNQIKEAVFQALGVASTCWQRMDETGVFDSTRAAQAGSELLEIIEKYAGSKADGPAKP